MPNEQEFNPAFYGGWPDALMRMAARMPKGNMNDMDAGELKVAAGILERSMKEVLRLRRQIGVLTAIDHPLPGLRVKDAGAFFDPEVCERVMNEVFSNPIGPPIVPQGEERVAQEFRSPVTPGIAVPETEKARHAVMGELGAAMARRVDDEVLGPRRGLTTEQGQSSERQDHINKQLQTRINSLEKFVYGTGLDGND